MVPYVCMVPQAASTQRAALTGLTTRQRQIVEYVEAAIARGRAPSRADIADHFGFNRATAQQHIVALERHGAIERLPGARGLRVKSERPLDVSRRVPIIGRVAAGQPLLAVEDVEDVIAVPSSLFVREPDVLLRVQGYILAGAGILDRDLIAVRLTSTAESGDIVVARLDEEITVKRLRRRGRRTELVAENAQFATIVVADDADFAIEGVVLGVLRRF